MTETTTHSEFQSLPCGKPQRKTLNFVKPFNQIYISSSHSQLTTNPHKSINFPHSFLEKYPRIQFSKNYQNENLKHNQTNRTKMCNLKHYKQKPIKKNPKKLIHIKNTNQ